MGKLDGRVAVITGAARGIGRDIAVTFAKEGSKVVIGDTLTKEMDITAEAIKNIGGKAVTVEANIAKKNEAELLIDSAIKNFCRLDILVNNAGISIKGSLQEITEEDWDSVFNVNLKGALFCTQAAGRHMTQQNYGKIINISSCSALGCYAPQSTAYAVSKAGLVALTKYCAVELGAFGINVNAIAPGMIMTDLTNIGRTPEQVAQLAAVTKKIAVIGRVGYPRDVASLALFLASDDSCYISGQVISVDGGRTDHL
jgi:3-oxoacyl-[acyl-carrier protein] reductase